jgi:hypothetical protein
MRRIRTGLAVSTLLAALLLAGDVRAQGPADQPADQSDVMRSFPRPPDAPRSLYSPASLEGPPHQVAPERYFEEDPHLDLPQLPAIGWFATAEASLLAPHVKNEVRNLVPFAGRLDPVGLPSAALDWTVAPRLEVGYRLPSGFGEFSLGYRFLASQGAQSAQALFGPATLSSRLDLNTVDLDYSSREISLGENWGMKWTVGGRLAFLYFDSLASQGFAIPGAPQFTVDQHTTNSFSGFGPHAGLELTRRIQGTGLSLVGKGDFATMLGRIRQGFEEGTSIPPPGSPVSPGELHTSGSQDIPVASTDAGIGWQPPSYPFAQFFLGYHFEYWWNAGRLSTSDARGEIWMQGITLRGEFVF